MLQKFKLWLSVAAAISSLSGGTALAQSLEDLEARLLDHPSLNALTYDAEAWRERSTAATALPDPVVSVGINNFPIFDPSFSEFLPTNKAVGIRQDFPNRAGREARAGEARMSAEQTDRIRSAQFATLRGELIALLYEQERIETQRQLAATQNEKYDELGGVVEAEIDAGRPVVYRLAEIEAERARVSSLLVDLDRQDAELGARLIDFVGYVPATPAPSVDPQDWSGDAIAFHAVRVAEAGIRVADHSVDGAKAAWRPNWGGAIDLSTARSRIEFFWR